MVQLVNETARSVGTRAACKALKVPRSSYYRWSDLRVPRPPKKRTGGRALSEEARDAVLAVLHEPRFIDQAPPQVYATLLDDGDYLCSLRTMYRVLQAHQEVRERRNQLRHPNYTKPELLATRPNELWSWDITKLHGPRKWTYFYLYVILDVFSRYIVGWMVAHRERAGLVGL